MENCKKEKIGFYVTLGYMLVILPAYANSLGKSLPNSVWGGEHIKLVITSTGATLEYDCANGTIDEPLRPDKDGNFKAPGTHVFERGGPGRPVEPPPKRHPAFYRGWTNGIEMRITVILLDTKREFGSFKLGKGRRPVLEKCL